MSPNATLSMVLSKGVRALVRVVLLASAAAFPGIAAAAIVGGLSITLQPSVTVGQPVLFVIAITNSNTNEDSVKSNNVSSITLVASCGFISGGACVAGNYDPGVFQLP